MTRHLTLIAALTSALALAACDTGNEASNADAKMSADSQHSSAAKNTASQDTDTKDADTQNAPLDDAATLTLNGTLSAPENATLPADAKIHVQLIDVTLEDGSATMLTEQAYDAKEVTLPLPFSLKMPSDALNDDHRQVLQAEVRDADDQVVWSTAEPEALALSAANQPAPVALLLEPVETAPNEEIEADEYEANEPEIGQAEPKAKTDAEAEVTAEEA